MGWTKYPSEEQVFQPDWSELLDGDTIVGDVTVSTIGSNGLTAEILNTVDNVSRVEISGGQPGTRGNIIFHFATAGGQTFDPVKSILILDPAAAHW